MREQPLEANQSLSYTKTVNTRESLTQSRSMQETREATKVVAYAVKVMLESFRKRKNEEIMIMTS